jgi:chorismate synthase
MSSTFGTLLKVSTFGESHGRAVGAVLDGCPPGIALTEADIQKQLDRRRPGQSELTTRRNETDTVSILSGVENGKTLGTPIGLMVPSRDQRPGDYQTLRSVPRPSHADYTYREKYGVHSSSGGGRASARETVGRVAAGAVAERMLSALCGVEIVAWVCAVGDISAPEIDTDCITRADVDRTPVRCPVEPSADRMAGLISETAGAADSVGGIVSCVCRNVPIGLGEPVFDKLDAVLAQAMLSIPAARGFDIGSGFSAAGMRGSDHNDLFVKKGNRLGTLTNQSGGVQGGISNGESIVFRVAFKPTATIGKPQQTADYDGNQVTLSGKGRHDPCVVPRAVPIVEAMAALVLGDMMLRQQKNKLPGHTAAAPGGGK